MRNVSNVSGPQRHDNIPDWSDRFLDDVTNLRPIDRQWHDVGAQRGGPARPNRRPSISLAGRSSSRARKISATTTRIGILQAAGKFVQQLPGPRDLVWLKNAPNSPARIDLADGWPARQPLRSDDGRSRRPRDTPLFAYCFKTPLSPREAFEPGADRRPSAPQWLASGGRRQGV